MKKPMLLPVAIAIASEALAQSVGIGTPTPGSNNRLDVFNSSLTVTQHAIHAVSGAVANSSISTASAIYAESSNGIAVIGLSSNHNGVYGYSSSGAFSGVVGYNTTTGGKGISGVAGAAQGIAGHFDGGAAGYGIIVSNGLSGFGALDPRAFVHINGSRDLMASLGAINFNHQALLVQTGSTSTSNISSAIIGYSGNSTYENHGLHAFANGPGGATFNVGAFCSGQATPNSTGNSYGVYGTASKGATNYGVYGVSTGAGYAGYFSGAIYATSATAGVKAFKIDDPRDPANRYLYHSSVESDEMMDIYKGHITTDASGNATVTLPSYVSVINGDYDYQLTCIGQFAQAIVSQEISNNVFKIKTDKPNVKVCWQVSGVRQDPLATTHRIIVETTKPDAERGTYLEPQLYGMGPEKALGYLPSAHVVSTATASSQPLQKNL